MATWIFVRHGESEANLLHEFSNHGRKHGLTGRGIQQAQQLLEKLHDYPISAIYSSPLLRAQQTAGIIGQGLGITPQVVQALTEFDTGVLEGKSDEASWERFHEIFDDWLIGKNYHRKFEGGESLTSVCDRFLPFFRDLKQELGASSKAILFVSHGGTLMCVLPRLLANIDDEFVTSHPLGHTAMVIAIELNGGLYCREWDGQIII